jgi:hypothetical protein
MDILITIAVVIFVLVIWKGMNLTIADIPDALGLLGTIGVFALLLWLVCKK